VAAQPQSAGLGWSSNVELTWPLKDLWVAYRLRGRHGEEKRKRSERQWFYGYEGLAND
jgi:hypothetical protein